MASGKGVRTCKKMSGPSADQMGSRGFWRPYWKSSVREFKPKH